MVIVNRVKNSGLITIDLEDFLPNENDLVELDIKNQLWHGLVLKEKDFRTYIELEDWSSYSDKIVCVHCSVDAIIPPWAYMLIASSLFGVSKQVYFGSAQVARESIVAEKIQLLDETQYKGARVVIKGCAKITNIESAFTALTWKLRGEVKSIMYGEPCSTVPIFKSKKE